MLNKLKNYHKKPIISYSLLFITTTLILIFQLQILAIDLSVPFNFWGDTIWFSVPIKGMIENGWVYEIPQLSAPFTLDASAFPSMTHVDWVLMKIISIFNPNFGVVLNVFWLCTIILSAISATLAMSLLGLKTSLAALFGLIYAFLPYAILRNVAHISLIYYCVPLLCMAAIWIAQGCDSCQENKIRLFAYIGAIAQGFNYIYFSFFALILLAFSALLGYARERKTKSIKEAVAISIIILISATINLTPSFLSWHNNGKPPDMVYKSPAEAEIYGLKIRKMLSPHEDNVIPVLGQWGRLDKNANFPNENENNSARLGPMGAIGLIFLFMISLGLIRLSDNAYSSKIKSVANLNLFAILVTTIGGFGAIFNLILPDFRAYNRFSVFIAFFALIALAFYWNSKYENTINKNKKRILIFLIVIATIFTLYDQLLGFVHLRNPRSNQESETVHLREIIKKVEESVPSGSSIFQLPITGFPPDGFREKMLPYAHGQAYLASSSLHWSWPSFSIKHRAWLDKIQALNSSNMLEALSLSKFRLVWIDRFGYRDNGIEIYKKLTDAGATEILTGISNRYVILDLVNITNNLKQKIGASEFEKRHHDIVNAPIISWGTGFYPGETTPDGRSFHWSQKNSYIEIENLNAVSRKFELSFLASAGNKGTLKVMFDNNTTTEIIDTTGFNFRIPIQIKASEKIKLFFIGEMGKIPLPPGETRDLHFYIMGLNVKSFEN
jgi:hypothetical protein